MKLSARGKQRSELSLDDITPKVVAATSSSRTKTLAIFCVDCSLILVPGYGQPFLFSFFFAAPEKLVLFSFSIRHYPTIGSTRPGFHLGAF